MLRLAILTARKRLGTYVGAFLALFGSAVLVMAGGMLLESALRSHAPVTRYAAAAAVVTGHQDVGPDHDVILGEPARISSALVARLAAVPGVRAAIADDAVPGRLGAHDVQAHGWSSAQLAPYRLVAGRPPATTNEVVTTFSSHLGARERLTLDGTRSHRHGRRDRARAFDAARRTADLPDGLRGRAPRRPSRPSRCDRDPRRSGARPRARPRGRRQRCGPRRQCAWKRRIAFRPDRAHAVDRRRRVVRRPRHVHRDLHRRGNDGADHPATRARDRTAARCRRDTRPGAPHDRVGSRDHLARRVGGGCRPRCSTREGARARFRSARDRAGGLHRHGRLASRNGSHRKRRHHRSLGRARRRTPRIPCRTNTRARRRRCRAARDRPRQADRRRDRNRGRRTAVLGLGGDAQPADGGRHLGAERPLPRRCRRLPRADRRAHRSGNAAPGALGDLTCRRLPRGGEPARGDPSLLVGQHTARAVDRAQLHLALQQHNPRPRGRTPSGAPACRRISPSPAPALGCRARLSPTCVRRGA